MNLVTRTRSHYSERVSHKSARIATMIESFRGQDLDAHYVGYFDCFNRQLFYEAHDVLEDLWLPDRHGSNGNFSQPSHKPVEAV